MRREKDLKSPSISLLWLISLTGWKSILLIQLKRHPVKSLCFWELFQVNLKIAMYMYKGYIKNPLLCVVNICQYDMKATHEWCLKPKDLSLNPCVSFDFFILSVQFYHPSICSVYLINQFTNSFIKNFLKIEENQPAHLFLIFQIGYKLYPQKNSWACVFIHSHTLLPWVFAFH